MSVLRLPPLYFFFLWVTVVRGPYLTTRLDVRHYYCVVVLQFME